MINAFLRWLQTWARFYVDVRSFNPPEVIQSVTVIEWRWPRLTREYTRYPRIVTVNRPDEEHRAANPEAITDWQRTASPRGNF